METTIKKIKETLTPQYSQGEINSIIKIIFDKLKNYSHVDIIMRKDEVLCDHTKREIDDILKRLLNREPIQYIFNEAYFQGFTLNVTQDTLIPRPETEELVDIIVKENKGCNLHVLDIGTGSGAIAIALAKSLRFPIVDATDISDKAIEIAKSNAKRLNVDINFSIEDILTATPTHNDIYDIIVSNPPYIANSERDSMEKNVLDYEPHSALFVPDNDVLLFYRAITEYAVKTLKPGGRIYFEINSRFGKETTLLLSQYGFMDIAIIKDMYGLDRFAVAKRPNDYDFL